MKRFKNEKEVREFFGSTTLKFQIICDGVAEFETVKPMRLDDGNYATFKVSVFPDDNPFSAYDALDDLLGSCQIFEVLNVDEDVILYRKKTLTLKKEEY